MFTTNFLTPESENSDLSDDRAKKKKFSFSREDIQLSLDKPLGKVVKIRMTRDPIELILPGHIFKLRKK